MKKNITDEPVEDPGAHSRACAHRRYDLVRIQNISIRVSSVNCVHIHILLLQNDRRNDDFVRYIKYVIILPAKSFVLPSELLLVIRRDVSRSKITLYNINAERHRRIGMYLQ